jgi:hypothetical protein
MTRRRSQHGLPTAPLASRLINQRAAPPWITLPHRRFRDSVTTVSRHRDRDFAESVTV